MYLGNGKCCSSKLSTFQVGLFVYLIEAVHLTLGIQPGWDPYHVHRSVPFVLVPPSLCTTLKWQKIQLFLIF